MKYFIQNQSGETVATVTTEPPQIIPADEMDPHGVGTWAQSGAPGWRGVCEDKVCSEQPILVSPADPFWGLALLEACDDRGWSLVPAVTVTASGSVTWDESKHLRNQKGSEHAGRFTKAQTPPRKILDLAEMKEFGGSLGGSTPGAQYKDKHGDVWYVKKVVDKAHAENEVLASRLYNLCGVATPEVQLVKDGEKFYVGSKVMQLLGPASVATPGAARGFAVDAWLANWDVVGASNDNLQIAGDGTAVRIDCGGSIAFRAKGGDKWSVFGDTVGEINSMRDPNGKNPMAAGLFGKMHADDVKASILSTVGNLTDAEIEFAVDTYVPTGIGGIATADLIARLQARRDFMVGLANEKLDAPAPKKAKSDMPSVEGKLFGLNEPVFHQTAFSQPAKIPHEPKPQFPSKWQKRTMLEASIAAKKNFKTSNWDDDAHPRPDEYGVPTNIDSLEYNRLLTLGRSFCADWKGSAQGDHASKIKRAAARVYGVKGVVWNNSGTDTPEQEWDNDRIVRMMMRDTRERFIAAGITEDDKIELFRGVKTHYTTPGVVEGYSYSRDAAAKFASYDLLKRHVSPENVLLDNGSTFFTGTGYGSEKEWIILTGHHGAVADTQISVKNKSNASSVTAAPVSGIKTFAGANTKTFLKHKVTTKPPGDADTPELKWEAVTDQKILDVKAMVAKGMKCSAISKSTGLAPSTIHGIKHGLTKKYATTGPRPAHMKDLLEVSDETWNTVKKLAAEQIKKHGKVDFNAVGAHVGLKGWKIQGIVFAQPKTKAADLNIKI